MDASVNPFEQYVGNLGILTTPAQRGTICMVQVFVRTGISITIPAFLEKDSTSASPGSAVRITGVSGVSGVLISNLEKS